MRPNAGRQLRRWRACEQWRTAAGGSCQARCVRPTAEAPIIPVAGSAWRRGDVALGQAVALCRVNRAQPTGRASGVRCTPWFGCVPGVENYELSE